MFGFRVGKFLALGIVPDGQSPSLYKQFLLLLLFVFPLTQTQLTLLQKMTFNILFSDNVICSQTWQQNLSPTAPNFCHFQNQHSTKCQADSLPLWVVLFPIFSPSQPPYLLRSKRKNFSRKLKNNKQTNKKAKQKRKAHISTNVCLGLKMCNQML